MTERTGFYLDKTPLTLLGDEVKVGDKAPAFTLLNPELTQVGLDNYGDKVKILVVVPSLDTGVCELETIRFNKEVAGLEGVTTVIISADLPFAQQRFAVEKDIEQVSFLSDHYDMNFGNAYGTHIKELRLENRSVFVLDGDNTVQYVEYLTQNVEQPQYDAILAKVRELIA